MELKNTVSQRGFRNIEFKDTYKHECSLQESSSAGDECIWFGMDRGVEIDGQVYARMHLSREMVEKLLPALEHFVKTGQLPTGNWEIDNGMKVIAKVKARKHKEALQIAADFLDDILEDIE